MLTYKYKTEDKYFFYMVIFSSIFLGIFIFTNYYAKEYIPYLVNIFNSDADSRKFAYNGLIGMFLCTSFLTPVLYLYIKLKSKNKSQLEFETNFDHVLRLFGLELINLFFIINCKDAIFSFLVFILVFAAYFAIIYLVFGNRNICDIGGPMVVSLIIFSNFYLLCIMFAMISKPFVALLTFLLFDFTICVCTNKFNRIEKSIKTGIVILIGLVLSIILSNLLYNFFITCLNFFIHLNFHFINYFVNKITNIIIYFDNDTLLIYLNVILFWAASYRIINDGFKLYDPNLYETKKDILIRCYNISNLSIAIIFVFILETLDTGLLFKKYNYNVDDIYITNKVINSVIGAISLVSLIIVFLDKRNDRRNQTN